MSNNEFIKISKKAVVDYFNSKKEKQDSFILTEDDVYVVWICKTLQNNKTLISTNIVDGMYYEITYNGDKKELYVDAYKKWDNFVIKYEG